MNGQIESAQADDVSAEDRTRIREFADEVLAERGDTARGTEPSEE